MSNSVKTLLRNLSQAKLDEIETEKQNQINYRIKIHNDAIDHLNRNLKNLVPSLEDLKTYASETGNTRYTVFELRDYYNSGTSHTINNKDYHGLYLDLLEKNYKTSMTSNVQQSDIVSVYSYNVNCYSVSVDYLVNYFSSIEIEGLGKPSVNIEYKTKEDGMLYQVFYEW